MSSAAAVATVSRVLVVDDHQTFAELLAGALDREHDLVAVGRARSAEEAVRQFATERPDLVLMDVQLPGRDGFAATREIVAMSDTVRVVMLTAHNDPENVMRAADAGACAFVPKDGSLEVMLATLRAARRGEFLGAPDLVAPRTGQASPQPSPDAPGPGGREQVHVPALTPREREVVGLLGEGMPVREIASTLGLAEETCRGYVKNLMTKLGARTQLQAVVTAWRLGILPRRDHG